MLGASDASTENALIERALAAIPRVASVVLSDYAKGVLTPRIISAVIKEARKFGKPVIVDPKGKDFSIYKGATMITPNRMSSPLRLADPQPATPRSKQRRPRSTVSLAVRQFW